MLRFLHRLYYVLDRLATAAGWGALLAFLWVLQGYAPAAEASVYLGLFWLLWGWVPPPPDSL